MKDEETARLVSRARELAALAKSADPAPWKAVRQPSGGYSIRMPHYERHSYWWRYGAYVNRQKEAELIAAAPEMAELLSQLANLLDKPKDNQ